METKTNAITSVKISEANSNGTLQITLPARAVAALNWKAGMTLKPLLLNAKKKNGEVVPFALLYHIPEGTNGMRLCTKPNELTPFNSVEEVDN